MNEAIVMLRVFAFTFVLVAGPFYLAHYLNKWITRISPPARCTSETER